MSWYIVALNDRQLYWFQFMYSTDWLITVQFCTQTIKNSTTAYPTMQMHTPTFRQEHAIKSDVMTTVYHDDVTSYFIDVSIPTPFPIWHIIWTFSHDMPYNPFHLTHNKALFSKQICGPFSLTHHSILFVWYTICPFPMTQHKALFTGHKYYPFPLANNMAFSPRQTCDPFPLTHHTFHLPWYLI